MSDVFDLTCDLVARRSITTEDAGCQALIAARLERAGFRCEHLRFGQTDNLWATHAGPGGDTGPVLVLLGHTDVVPPGPVEQWTSDPFVPTVRDGHLYGRGTADMKGGVAVMLAAAAELTEPRHDVTWIFYDHEEVEAAKNGLGRLGRNRPDLLAGEFAVLMEPTGARIEGGCQGTLRFQVTLVGKASHSARSWLGHNAVHDAGGVLSLLAAHEPRRVVVDGLEYREGLNAVAITGGIAGNVIPDRCTVTINFRFAPDRSVEQAEQYCRNVLPGYELVFTDTAPAARPGLDLPAAQDFLAAVGGEARAKYGWTDVARFSELGVPAVNYGPGDPGKAHADDECCPVEDLHTCHDALLRWLV